MTQKLSITEEHLHTFSKPSKSPLKIEDKLMSYKIQAKKRLELLKQSLEQEQLKELQKKPKILKKSRILAENHEKKYFDSSGNDKELSTDDKFSESGKGKDFHCTVTVRSVPYSPSSSSSPKRCSRIVKNQSIIERSQVWLQAKKDKLGEKRMIKEKNALAECTFSPSMMKKSPKRSERSLKEETLTPKSIETFAESSQRLKRFIKPQFVPKTLTPVQQRISFSSGIDIERFLKRAK